MIAITPHQNNSAELKSLLSIIFLQTYYKRENMKQIIFIFITTLSMLILTNCGGSRHTKVATNTIDTDVKKHFEYFKYGYLSKETNTTVCYKGLNGDSYQTYINIYDDTIVFDTSVYRLEDCSGEPFYYVYSSYNYQLGNESSDKKRLEVTLTNSSYNYNDKDYKIEEMVSNYIFGTFINGNPYYTYVVSSGNIRKEKIRIGFAKPSSSNDGTDSEKRANDVSRFINQELFFIEDTY